MTPKYQVDSFGINGNELSEVVQEAVDYCNTNDFTIVSMLNDEWYVTVVYFKEPK